MLIVTNSLARMGCHGIPMKLRLANMAHTKSIGKHVNGLCVSVKFVCRIVHYLNMSAFYLYLLSSLETVFPIAQT